LTARRYAAREYESLHQFVLRGISRNFDSTETQIVYVFDEWQARSLTDNIEYIDLGIDDETRAERQTARLNEQGKAFHS
jgi:hypothetical protein